MNPNCKTAVERAARAVDVWYEPGRMATSFYTELAFLLDDETIDPVIDSLPADVRALFVAELREHIGDESSPLHTYDYREGVTILPGGEAAYEAWRQGRTARFNNVIVPAVRAWLTRHPTAR